MFDTHVHTTFSTDSKLSIDKAVKKAYDDNLGLILTEHMDLKFPVEGEFTFDIDKYFQEYHKYRNNKLLLGIELGMRDDCINENADIGKGYPFDYVLGSIHFVNGIDIYEKSFYDGKTKKDAYNEYFENMLENIKSHSYIDSLGHIDYICRYAQYEDKDIHYREHGDIIDEILKALIDRNIAIEINTRRLSSKDTVNSLIDIYKRFSELKGKYVTIGSDSHSENSIGFNYNQALKIAELCKLTPVYFKNRKMEYV
ncbi:putative histidinol-phosphatase [Clostridium pasteurianum DSM 525 = ATCC 6013]|uniref:Histidinol-phosphatase n=1 Tax=Clostridium pasteurianum DSM 525 = ATCC 6013 TaxID=1262449 RepID=A0A0H3J800_CLOPA|nr:histidinol phosphate phosphatase [Clostridium pasteurianum]AJA49337.1 putative histidinol-phosphatase [Clostridium pasteurianum DSM 525 = ATCC 6013]AJA53325.1 putative histidinol-phosphatase [Clostridium pasteurianum DSM 525 = ATCC 6013]AOZ76512.1 histidinol phosphatase [Clostridium pasteurianum DSM 525 = ATCC 6013]AOZ80309.1 histidinol phosphatase [Clostridium pasteurianum]ELP58357.1 histidinol-phosphatase [Clostridium pasteurianum DSM 525 = ATCC 6013]